MVLVVVMAVVAKLGLVVAVVKVGYSGAGRQHDDDSLQSS